MKKLLCILLICALCGCGLAGCGKRDDSSQGGQDSGASTVAEADPGVTPVPEEGAHGEEDQSAALAQLPTLAPAETLPAGDTDQPTSSSDDYYSIDDLINQADEQVDGQEESAEAGTQPQAVVSSPNAIDPNTVSFSALNEASLGFTFNYPSGWINIPGLYTICYREQVEPGDFPARVAISGKRLVHSPEGTVLTDELTSFVRTIYKQYDADTFQLGTPNLQDTFLGKQAVSNTYLAYSGETEVKGFVIGCAVGRVLYVFHFSASYEDYTAMERVMRYMLNSVQLIQAEDKEN